MKCPYGFQIGHDYDLYDECNCSLCKDSTYGYCRNYRKSCIGKKDYGSRTMAEREAWHMSTKNAIKIKYDNAFLIKEGNLIAYNCLYCGGWHIGRNWN